MASYKYVPQTGTVSSIEDAFSALEELGSEAREIVDNAPEGLNQTDRINTFEDTASTLEGLSAPDVPSCVADLAITYSDAVPTRKRASISRSRRRDNAVGVLTAAKDACEEWVNTQNDIVTAMREREDMETEELEGLEDIEGVDGRDMAEIEEQISEVESFMDDLDSAISDAEGVDFPGMFG